MRRGVALAPIPLLSGFHCITKSPGSPSQHNHVHGQHVVHRQQTAVMPSQMHVRRFQGLVSSYNRRENSLTPEALIYTTWKLSQDKTEPEADSL